MVSEVIAVDFDALVAHGRANGANIVNGMPWSFRCMGLFVTHENDDCYLVNMPDGSTLQVHRPAAEPADPSKSQVKRIKLQKGEDSGALGADTGRMNHIARNKLSELQAQGWNVNGVALCRNGERGLIDNLGAVHWIARPPSGAAALPDAVEILAMLREKWTAYGLTDDEQKARAFDTRMDLLLMEAANSQPARSQG